MDISVGSFYWEEATGVLYNYSGTYPVRVTLAEFGEEDQIALKSENDELKTKLNNYIKSHQDLARLVGDNVTKIVTMNSQISNLQHENESLRAKLDALVNKLTLIKYTFSVPNSNTIRYQFEKQLDEYDGTLYLTYNETRDNVTSVNEIKISISFNVNNSPKFEYQCEPTKIWLNNIEFPLSSSNLMINATVNYILINSSFFTSNGILLEDNTKNEIHSLL